MVLCRHKGLLLARLQSYAIGVYVPACEFVVDDVDVGLHRSFCALHDLVESHWGVVGVALVLLVEGTYCLLLELQIHYSFIRFSLLYKNQSVLELI